MAKQTVNTGTSANDRSGDTLRGAGVKINANFTELYDILGGQIGTNTTKLTDSGFDVVGTSFRTKIGAVDPTAERSINFPNASGNVILDTMSQTLTNKTLNSAALSSPTISSLQLFDNDSSHRYSLVTGALTGNHNINIPPLSDSDTLVFNNKAATLLQKTLDAPVTKRPKIHEYLADSVGNSIISFTNTFTSGRNSVKIDDAAGGSHPSITAHGATSNINLLINSKGTGAVQVDKAAVSQATNANSTTASTVTSMVVLTGTSTGSVTLLDGTTPGEIKYVIRRSGTGTVTLNCSGSLGLAQGNNVEFGANDTATLIWDGTTGWNIIGGYGYTVT